MKIIEINNKESLNNFIVQHGNSNFLQSWEWGEFQKSLGRKIWRLGAEHDRKLVASALIVKNDLPLGKSYLYCPRGPVFNLKSKIENLKSEEIRNLFFGKIGEIAQEEKAIFWRFDWPDPGLPRFLRENKKLIKAPQDVQPKNTLILDLDQSEAEVLAQMKAKTRYNIRLAERRGVKTRQSVSQKDIDAFLKLIAITSQRDHFKAHSAAYYQKMADFFGCQGLLKIFLAEYKDQVLVANLVFFWGKAATYLHGASGNSHRNLMAPHLLQWTQILEAKKQGCGEYDFWGIAGEAKSAKRPPAIACASGASGRGKAPACHRLLAKPTAGRQSGGAECKVKGWEGITRFKKGFGGKEVSYAGTYDFILNPFWYKIYRLIR